jgi:DHA3 family multidrug efflux protein-like MFS transporter
MKIFYHLLANNIISSITNFTVWFALVFFSYLQTQSVFVTGFISGLFLAATAISGFWFGSLVDNYKKKSMMLLSSVVSLISYITGLIIYITVPLNVFSSPQNPLLWILIITLMTGVIFSGIRNIAMPTLVTFIVPENNRDKANGLLGTAFGISFLVTSVISGLLVGFSGLYLVLILAIVFTILSIIYLWKIPLNEPAAAKTKDLETKKVDIPGTIKIISSIPGFIALMLFTAFNNFLGGVFAALMDAYGLSLVPVQTWGLLWGLLSTGFIIGGLLISKFGLGENPLNTFFTANIVIWTVSSVFTLYPSIFPLAVGMFIYITIVPYIEASEQTIIQKVVPKERQGRVFGFAHSVEQSASPLTAFLIGPLTQFVFIPFMTTGKGADWIGNWFGTGPSRGIALVFTIAGIIGLTITLIARRSKSTKLLSIAYLNHSNASSK